MGEETVPFLYVALCTPIGTEGVCNTPRHLDVEGRCAKGGKITAGKLPLANGWPNLGALERPAGNAGILVGKQHGLLGFDVDTPAARDTYDGWSLPETRRHKTGAGFHDIWRWPEGVDNLPGLIDGVLLRSNGQLVAPGSLHWSGRLYVVESDVEPVELPAWFLASVQEGTLQGEREGGRASPGTAIRDDRLTGFAVHEGGRTKSLERLVGFHRGRDDPIAAALAAAVLHNVTWCDPPLPVDKVEDTVRGIYRRYPPSSRLARIPLGASAVDASAPNTVEPSAPAELDTEGGGLACLDWAALFGGDDEAQDWIYDSVLARGRGHAIFATHKAGKSLLLLYIVAKLATGPDPIVVLYLDYEMTPADVRDRLYDMGYDSESDISRLRYVLLPTLAPLDSKAGGDGLLAFVDREQAKWPDHHLVICLDTTSRAVVGAENDADTIRAFYRHTGLGLKSRGVTWVRLDHAGKDISLGQRGTSAKADDVDVVWRLTKKDGAVTLHREAARMGWVPEDVTLKMVEGPPLTYQRIEMAWPAGTKECAERLDELGVGLDASRREAARIIREAGFPARNETLGAALKWRRGGSRRLTIVESE